MREEVREKVRAESEGRRELRMKEESDGEGREVRVELRVREDKRE